MNLLPSNVPSNAGVDEWTRDDESGRKPERMNGSGRVKASGSNLQNLHRGFDSRRRLSGFVGVFSRNAQRANPHPATDPSNALPIRSWRLRGYDGREFRTDEEHAARRRVPVAYLVFQGWGEISFGLHVSLTDPNIEIHLPFFFARIGWQR